MFSLGVAIFISVSRPTYLGTIYYHGAYLHVTPSNVLTPRPHIPGHVIGIDVVRYLTAVMKKSEPQFNSELCVEESHAADTGVSPVTSARGFGKSLSWGVLT